MKEPLPPNPLPETERGGQKSEVLAQPGVSPVLLPPLRFGEGGWGEGLDSQPLCSGNAGVSVISVERLTLSVERVTFSVLSHDIPDFRHDTHGHPRRAGGLSSEPANGGAGLDAARLTEDASVRRDYDALSAASTF